MAPEAALTSIVGVLATIIEVLTILMALLSIALRLRPTTHPRAIPVLLAAVAGLAFSQIGRLILDLEFGGPLGFVALVAVVLALLVAVLPWSPRPTPTVDRGKRP